MATSRPDDKSFEALFTAEYPRVAGIANRVLADPQQIHLAMSGVAAVGAPLVIGCFLLALRGHRAASQIVEDVAQGARAHP